MYSGAARESQCLLGLVSQLIILSLTVCCNAIDRYCFIFFIVFNVDDDRYYSDYRRRSFAA